MALKEREDYEEQLLEVIEENFAFLTDEFWADGDKVSGREKKEDEGGDGHFSSIMFFSLIPSNTSCLSLTFLFSSFSL